MAQIYPHLLTADAVILVTPLYYFGMTAQLKRTIDRFFLLILYYAKQLFLVAACGDKDAWAMDALVVHFQTLCRYLHWQEGGKVLAIGAYTRKDVEDSDYPIMARNLGAGLELHLMPQSFLYNSYFYSYFAKDSMDGLNFSLSYFGEMYQSDSPSGRRLTRGSVLFP